MMQFADLTFEETKSFPQGVISVVRFGEYDLSVIRNEISYGYKQGLYEIGVFKGDDMVELPGITEQGDAVKGWLTEHEVSSVMKKLYFMTRSDPVQL